MQNLLVITADQSEKQAIVAYLKQHFPQSKVASLHPDLVPRLTTESRFAAIISCATINWSKTRDLLSSVRSKFPATPQILYSPQPNIAAVLAVVPALIDDFVLHYQELAKAIHTTTRRYESPPKTSALSLPELLASLDIPIMAVSDSGMVTLCNEAFAAVYEKDCSALIGHSYKTAFSDPEFQSFHAALTETLATGQKMVLDGWLYGKRSLRVTIIPTPVGLVTLSEDVTEQFKALEELRHSEAQLGLLFSLAPIGMIITTAKGKILSTNQAYQELVGYTANELRQFSFQDITHPDDVSFNIGLHQQLLNGEINDYSLEKRYVHKDGRTIYIFLQVALVRDHEGKPNQLIGQAVDITELKAAEKARLATEKRLDQTFDLAPFGMLVVSAAGQVRRVNEAFCNFSGFDVESLLESGFTGTLCQTDASLATRLMKRLANNIVEEVQVELIFRTRDGRKAPAFLQMSPFPSDEGDAPNILVMVVDLAERQAAEEELRSQAQNLSILFALSNQLRQANSVAEVANIAINNVHKITAAGVSVLYLAEPGRKALQLQKVWPDTIQMRRRIPIDEGIMGKVFMTGEPYLSPSIIADPTAQLTEMERRHIASIGAGFHFPLEADDEIFGVLTVGIKAGMTATNKQIDMLTAIAALTESALHRANVIETLEQRVEERTNELATANERLKELDKLKSKFVSDVSHELRTPVTNLNLYLDLLRDGREERRSHYQDVLKEQATRLRQLTEDILDLSRLELANNRVSLVTTDLNSLVNKVFVGHQPRASDSGLVFEMTLDHSLPPILAEPNQLTQVITNLVSNAINYTPAGSVIVETRFEPVGNEVVLSVADTGFGINPDEIRHIFDRFYRGRHTGQLTIPGSGLGLAIAKEVVDLHRGRIEIIPRPQGGTIMQVSLPIMAPVPA